jgi:hypothetical protein
MHKHHQNTRVQSRENCYLCPPRCSQAPHKSQNAPKNGVQKLRHVGSENEFGSDHRQRNNVNRRTNVYVS